jgi:hypothetical protein
MITCERRDKPNFITVSSFGESLLKRKTLVEEAFFIKVVLRPGFLDLSIIFL